MDNHLIRIAELNYIWRRKFFCIRNIIERRMFGALEYYYIKWSKENYLLII